MRQGKDISMTPAKPRVRELYAANSAAIRHPYMWKKAGRAASAAKVYLQKPHIGKSIYGGGNQNAR